DAARRGCRHEITTVDALPRHSGDRRVAAGPGLGSGTDAGAAWLLAMLSISTVPVPIAGAPSSSHPRPEATDGLAIAPPGSPQPGAPRHPGSGAPGPPVRPPLRAARILAWEASAHGSAAEVLGLGLRGSAAAARGGRGGWPRRAGQPPSV